ncbi:MAG: hypothetical protein ACO3G9_05285 [Chthoniobacterales bacterium]|jgi:hypothetical protein
MKTTRDGSAKRGAIFRPSSAGWQKWGEEAGAAWVLRGEAPELAELAPSAGDLIAVPVRRAFSLCVWIPADDPSIFRDLVLTQLEMRGLAGRSRDETSLAWREIAREGNEALVQVTVLPAHLAPRYWHGEVTDYALSPACLPLDAEAVTIWQEEGSWVAAVTRGGKLLHFQSLAEPSPDGAMALEIWMMLAPLEAGNMVGEHLPVVFYRPPGADIDLASWSQSAAGGAEVRDFPPPRRPAEPLECVPIAVRHLQTEKKNSARRQRLAFVGAALYLVLVLLLAGNTLWLHSRSQGLQSEIDSLAPGVAATKDAMNQWQALQPALDPAAYPLEVLFQTARLLPEKGVRLTLFDMNLQQVAIQGEASTLQAAIKFKEDLENNQNLTDFYEWSSEKPRQLPNGSTRFQINGVRRGASAEENDESTDI